MFIVSFVWAVTSSLKASLNVLNINSLRIGAPNLTKNHEMLYEAVYQPDGNNLIPKSVIDSIEVRIYIDDFVTMKDDYCFVADFNGQIVGAVWVRLLAGEINLHLVQFECLKLAI